MGVEFVSVQVMVDGKKQTIQMEKGTSFENKDGKYIIDDNGQLKKFDKSSNVWQDASSVQMKSSQWEVFQSIANNDGDVTTYSKSDIEKALGMSEGEFERDLRADLPAGMRVERNSSASGDGTVAVDAGAIGGKAETLKFALAEIAEMKEASQAIYSEKEKEVIVEKIVEVEKEVIVPVALDGANQELVSKFAAEFKDMSPVDIVNKFKWQILGWSDNETTLSMFDAIPKDKLKDVMLLYLTHFNMLEDMDREFGIGDEDIKPRLTNYVEYLYETQQIDSVKRGELFQSIESANWTNFLKRLDEDGFNQLENRLAIAENIASHAPSF